MMRMKTRDITKATFLALCTWSICHAFNCRFPNEGCDDDSECCSGKCVDRHPGTNPRCTKLGPCLYTYQCEDRLRCGSTNTCCAKYWGTCTHARDCCDKTQNCYEVEGFYYKRCLYSKDVRSGAESRNSLVLTLVTCTITACVNHLR